MQKTIPQHVRDCRFWLLKNGRMNDANFISVVIENCEKAINLGQKIACGAPEAFLLKSLLEEYCNTNKITPAYKQSQEKTWTYRDYTSWEGTLNTDINLENMKKIFSEFGI